MAVQLSSQHFPDTRRGGKDDQDPIPKTGCQAVKVPEPGKHAVAEHYVFLPGSSGSTRSGRRSFMGTKTRFEFSLRDLEEPVFGPIVNLLDAPQGSPGSA